MKTKIPIFQRTHTSTRGSNYIGTFRNSAAGNKLFAGLSVLYRPWGRIYKQGRHPNRKHLSKVTGRNHTDLRRGVPISLSTTYDVYLNRTKFPMGQGRQQYFNRELDGIPAIHAVVAEMLQG
jgi:hypothetical protein